VISARYSLPVILLMALTLVPTVIHSYMQAREDDGRRTESISTTLAGMSSRPYTRHSPEWVKGMFDSEDWIERIYKNTNGDKVRLFVARSYNHKRLYHHPELGLSHGSDLIALGIVTMPGKPEVPVHLLTGNSGMGMVAYVLLYDDRLIHDPLQHQLGESLNLLVNPRRAMTMFYVDVSTQQAGDDFTLTAGARILNAAVQNFLASKKSGSNM